MLELTVRLVASLAVVVGLLLVLARLVGKRMSGREGAPVQVLHRQPLSRSASVSVVSVGGRILVVGATDQQVQLLTELDPEELEVPVVAELSDGLRLEPPLPLEVTSRDGGPEVARRAGAHRATSSQRPVDPGALTGSVLSAQTWRQALAAATGKAS